MISEGGTLRVVLQIPHQMDDIGGRDALCSVTDTALDG